MHYSPREGKDCQRPTHHPSDLFCEEDLFTGRLFIVFVVAFSPGVEKQAWYVAMAAAAIAAKAAVNRKLARQKKEAYEAAIAAGLDPEEEFMKRVLAKMEEEKKASMTKWQNPELWSGWPKKYVKLANKAQAVAEGDRFNLFIIGVIIAAGVVVGFQTYAENDAVYFCSDAIGKRFNRCLDNSSTCE